MTAQLGVGAEARAAPVTALVAMRLPLLATIAVGVLTVVVLRGIL